MSQAATKEDLKVLGTDLRGEIKTLGSNLRDEIRENTRDIISHFNQSQGKQNEELKKMGVQLAIIGEDVSELKDDMSKVKLAVVDIMATDRHMHNLVTALKGQGLKLNDAEIFRS